MTTDISSDRNLVRSYVEGEPEAHTLVDGWIRSAAFSFRRRLANTWNDLLQDLHLEVFRLLQEGKFKGDSSLKTYVWRVVHHTCVDHCRARNRNREDEMGDPEDMERLWSKPASQSSRTADRDLLLRVLHEMSEDCRRLWRMIAEGLSYREMSEKLDATAGALRVRVLRCRKKALELRDDLLRNKTPESNA